jgi:hypothetical protein
MEKYNQKYHDYFVSNIGDGKFLNYVTVPFIAQEGYTNNNIEQEDFLDCINNIPIFSEYFVNIMKNDFSEEMDFIKCNVKCSGKIYNYYIGKIIKTKKFIDEENSEYRNLSDGSKIINTIKYYQNINEGDFIIARDITYNFIFLVNDKFKELIDKNNLKIKLKEIN